MLQAGVYSVTRCLYSPLRSQLFFHDYYKGPQFPDVYVILQWGSDTVEFKQSKFRYQEVHPGELIAKFSQGASWDQIFRRQFRGYLVRLS